jgi:hypothetical protein
MAASSLTAHGDVVSRMRALIRQDDAGGALYGYEKGTPGRVTDFESSIGTWGFCYGLAFALARMDADPFEPNTDVGDRAYEAAWTVFIGYNGPYPEANRDVLVETLEAEYDKAFEAAGHIESSDEVRLTPGLRKAIHQLLASGGRQGEGE